MEESERYDRTTHTDGKQTNKKTGQGKTAHSGKVCEVEIYSEPHHTLSPILRSRRRHFFVACDMCATHVVFG